MNLSVMQFPAVSVGCETVVCSFADGEQHVGGKPCTSIWRKMEELTSSAKP